MDFSKGHHLIRRYPSKKTLIFLIPNNDFMSYREVKAH